MVAYRSKYSYSRALAMLLITGAGIASARSAAHAVRNRTRRGRFRASFGLPRMHLLEIEDERWCPKVLRDCMTDYLEFLMTCARPYARAIPLLALALRRAGSRRVVDLCSGAGGPWRNVLRKLPGVEVTFTDLHPNLPALRRLHRDAVGRVNAHPDAVDARAVPPELRGFRTMFCAFHHFRPSEAQAILRDAARNGEGIAIFELTRRSLPALLSMALVPIFVVATAPFMRPFRWSRLVFTYLVPVLPLACWFDGTVSCLRSYRADEMLALGEQASPELEWRSGTVRGGGGFGRITYLIGVPRGRHSADERP